MTVADGKITQNFVDALNAKFAKEGQTFEAIACGNYNKIVITSSRGQRYQFAFVEIKTGLLYRAFSWTTPAKGARYDLNTAEEFARVVEIADSRGSFLFLN